jgi:hypothetical protein
MLMKEMLDNVFKYHAPTPEDVVHYEALRAAAKQFAATVFEHSPTCADQSVAIRKIREALHIANAAVALKGEV